MSSTKTIHFNPWCSNLFGVTGTPNEFVLKKVGVNLLEMEDVLFHLNSAVMMPEAPSGESSENGSEDDATDTDRQQIQQQQERVTGINALALVIKQFELKPDKKIVIAGHADTSGNPRFNFELSRLRAYNIYYLLSDQQGEWARICESRHKIEDYQQIMTYFAGKNGWDCDPQGIDDTWGERTDRATRNFFSQVAPSDEAERLYNQVRSSRQKKWPRRAWELVYEQYFAVLCEAFGEKAEHHGNTVQAL